MQHPRGMGSTEVEAFINMLANERQVSPSTHNQALSSFIFALGLHLRTALLFPLTIRIANHFL